MAKILLVDDAQDSHLLVSSVLDDDHHLVSAFNIQQAREILSQEIFDIVLLDVGLPDGNGFDFCAEIRKEPKFQDLPVIFLTGKSEISDKQQGFSLGAEDYIVKPFDPLEVKLRFENRIRKLKEGQEKQSLFRVGDLELDVDNQTVTLLVGETSERIDIPPKGFKILLFLAKHPGEVFTREQIIEGVWGKGVNIVDRTIDTHIGTVRKLLSRSTVGIVSVHGIGYRLRVDTGHHGRQAS